MVTVTVSTDNDGGDNDVDSDATPSEAKPLIRWSLASHSSVHYSSRCSQPHFPRWACYPSTMRCPYPPAAAATIDVVAIERWPWIWSLPDGIDPDPGLDPYVSGDDGPTFCCCCCCRCCCCWCY